MSELSGHIVAVRPGGQSSATLHCFDSVLVAVQLLVQAL